MSLHALQVFTEFIVICAYLGRAAKRLLSLMHVLFREAYAEWKEPGGGYKYRLQVGDQGDLFRKQIPIGWVRLLRLVERRPRVLKHQGFVALCWPLLRP